MAFNTRCDYNAKQERCGGLEFTKLPRPPRDLATIPHFPCRAALFLSLPNHLFSRETLLTKCLLAAYSTPKPMYDLCRTNPTASSTTFQNADFLMKHWPSLVSTVFQPVCMVMTMHYLSMTDDRNIENTFLGTLHTLIFG